MEERKGDSRIYIITVLIFLCVVSGGFFLCLYIFLPETQSKPWYPIAGIILVAIPWAFWFLIYLYSCFKPINPQPNGSGSSITRATSVPAAVTAANLSNTESPVHSPGGQRRVHFGAVVVMGNQPVGGGGDQGGGGVRDSHESHSQETRNDSIGSRESEVPLTLSASS